MKPEVRRNQIWGMVSPCWPVVFSFPSGNAACLRGCVLEGVRGTKLAGLSPKNVMGG